MRMFSLACIALLSFGASSEARDIENGQAIAERWCSQCHIVSPGQTTPASDIVTFSEIAKRFADDQSALSALLSDAHPPMPDMSLTRQEIADLVAFIGSLR
jgi:mono/diheme cytochrome c family protein